MPTFLLSIAVAALLGSANLTPPDLHGTAEPQKLLRLADPGGVVYERGDSRRPRAEIPAMSAPAQGESKSPGQVPSPSEQGGERAEGSRDLGEHRPGELYLVPGEHRPGDLDRQGTFRPGDLG